jgi:hypothetical protein
MACPEKMLGFFDDDMLQLFESERETLKRVFREDRCRRGGCPAFFSCVELVTTSG